MAAQQGYDEFNMSRLSSASRPRPETDVAESDDIPLMDFNKAKEPQHPQVRQSRRSTAWSTLAWWLPELVASVFSIASFAAIVIILSIFDRRPLASLGLPRGLTLNALISALATINRTALLVPISSVVLQEFWHFYVDAARQSICSSRLEHLGTFDAASRGPWGSFTLLYHLRGRRYVCTLEIRKRK